MHREEKGARIPRARGQTEEEWLAETQARAVSRAQKCVSETERSAGQLCRCCRNVRCEDSTEASIRLGGPWGA